ncbi:hypothetical protein FRX31_035442 [Thalictrum thalictroides]|uniref:Uncharacterized protein n=1 Tax=Thalictrum thalictroides TaxID=46969 RepID=A0A7J6UQX0_THATH|nr:hypothetical protein FRX31_035442 [Thalictrum thalictroides]
MSMKRAYPELGFLTPPSSNNKVGRGVVGVEDDDGTPTSKIEDSIEGKGIEIATKKGIPNYVGSARTTIQLGEGLNAMCGIDDGMQDGVQTQGCHDHQATQPRLLKVSMDKEGGAAMAKVSVTDKVQIDAISTSIITTVEGTSKESGQQVAIVYPSLIEEMNNKGASRSEIEGNYGVHTTPKFKVRSWAKESEEGTQFVEHGKLDQFKVNSEMGLYGLHSPKKTMDKNDNEGSSQTWASELGRKERGGSSKGEDSSQAPYERTNPEGNKENLNMEEMVRGPGAPA